MSHQITNSSLAPVFLFDVDGVLVASHDFQAEALSQAMSELANKYTLDYSGASEQLLNILQGGTEKLVVQGISQNFPVFQPHIAELFKNAWTKYYNMIETNPTGWRIESSLQLLKMLCDIGYQVCLVSNSKRADVERYSRLLNINTNFVCLEDFDEPKPSPKPYLTAAKKLGANPSLCIVFEDSTQGVISAKSAGMYVVGLHRESFLPPIGADETVSSLLLSSKLKEFIYPSVNNGFMVDGLTVQAITVQSLNEIQQQEIVSATYQIYSSIFSGRSIESWKLRLVDSEDIITRIGLCYHENILVGYTIIKLRKIIFNGETQHITLVSAGTLEKYYGGMATLHFLQIEFRRMLLAFPNIKNNIIDNFLSFGGYKLGLNCFFNVFPSLDNPNLDKDTLDFMQFLAKHVGYKKAEISHPFIYHSSSTLNCRSSSPNSPTVSSSYSSNFQFFQKQLENLSGVGLLAMIPISFANIRPMQQLQKKLVSRL